MGKIKNYTADHNTGDYFYSWVHEDTGRRIGVVARSALRDRWENEHNHYAVVRERHNQPRIITRFVHQQKHARRIGVNIARENPEGPFENFTLPAWGEYRTVPTKLGHIGVLVEKSSPSRSIDSVRKHLRKRGYHAEAETL